MKTFYQILILLGIGLFLSFSSKRKECRVSFGVNSKFKVEEQAKDGTFRMYTNSKGTFKLGLYKIESEAPETESLDSLRVWLKNFRTNRTIDDVDYDTLIINDIPLKNVSFSKTLDKVKWQFNTFIFSSNSHYYKMEIKYLANKEEKSRKEISKILNSLEIDC